VNKKITIQQLIDELRSEVPHKELKIDVQNNSMYVDDNNLLIIDNQKVCLLLF